MEPSGTELLGCIAPESANIRAYHLNAPHVALNVVGDGQRKPLERGIIITRPMESISIASWIIGPADDKWDEPLFSQKFICIFLLLDGHHAVNMGI